MGDEKRGSGMAGDFLELECRIGNGIMEFIMLT